jgi:hypothetical protein
MFQLLGFSLSGFRVHVTSFFLLLACFVALLTTMFGCALSSYFFLIYFPFAVVGFTRVLVLPSSTVDLGQVAVLGFVSFFLLISSGVLVFQSHKKRVFCAVLFFLVSSYICLGCV